MELSTPLALFVLYLLLNVIAFCVYWWDKQAAIEGTWRISERTLLGVAFIGGSLGALAAQQMLRHKTRKEPFRTLLMIIIILHALGAASWLLAPELAKSVIVAIAGRSRSSARRYPALRGRGVSIGRPIARRDRSSGNSWWRAS
ncbi:DUF1294 domain-containing protein [Neorhizobium galegae]|uniref:DUF1294 domain-containing protein n=1 Tax=Neorhizobium galegae TaxID=399 RepID=A0A6A1TMR5_NEOGA|nr:DUF1294 domain-containing protein [Neorhizobium galegae]KAB1086141.1 DUF1294 domain-containing protein [Neorhizobium galegae]